MHLSISSRTFTMKNKTTFFLWIITSTLLVLLVSPYGFASSSTMMDTFSTQVSSHYIYGTAVYDGGSEATAARVDVVSSLGKLTTCWF